MNPDEQNNALITALVTLGRIEEKLANMAGLENRIREVENTLTRIQAQQKPKAPWYSVIAAVVGIVTGVGTLVTLMIVLINVVSALEGKL